VPLFPEIVEVTQQMSFLSSLKCEDLCCTIYLKKTKAAPLQAIKALGEEEV
jgi:hypothetical protein